MARGAITPKRGASIWGMRENAEMGKRDRRKLKIALTGCHFCIMQSLRRKLWHPHCVTGGQLHMESQKTNHSRGLLLLSNGAATIADAFGVSYYDRVYDDLAAHMTRAHPPIDASDVEQHNAYQFFLLTYKNAAADFHNIWFDLGEAIDQQFTLNPELSHVRSRVLAEAD